VDLISGGMVPPLIRLIQHLQIDIHARLM